MAPNLEEVIRIMPLEKNELALIFGLSLREFGRNIPEQMKEEMGWRRKGRRKILPKHFPAIFEHFYGTKDGWQLFFRGLKKQ